MAISINTNIASLNAQRNLNKSQSALSKSMQRLSTGLRINSAKDDAAGLAISGRMTSQIRGLNQSVRNANDGISLAQTAEGAMGETTNILQRMRELAVQGSNSTYSDSDRASMQAEMDQLYEEIDRIAGSTEYNGIKLLDGSGGARTFQVGANSGQTVSLSLGSVKTSDLNLNGYSGLGEANGGRIAAAGGAITGSNLEINGTSIAGIAASDAKDLAAHLTKQQADTGVTASAYNVVEGNSGASGVTTGLTINTNVVADSGSMSELVENINRDVAGVTATLNSDGALVLSNDTGENITIANGTAGNTGLDDNAGVAYGGYVSLTSNDGSEIDIAVESGGTAAAGVNAIGFNASTGSDDVTGSNVGAVALAAGELEINGVDIGDVSGTSAGDIAASINALSDETGVSGQATTTVQGVGGGNTGIIAAGTDLLINGVDIALAKGAATTDMADLVSVINSNVQGVTATTDEDGFLVLTSESGNDIAVAGSAGGLAAAGLTAVTNRGSITLTGADGADVKIGGTNAAKAGFVEQGGSDEAVGAGLSLSNVANSNNAIDRIDAALNKVADFRGNMGAVQNRLDSTIANLNNVAENVTAARSRILDADIAQETSAMTKQNILQQAGVSILAQANQAPQLALSLLG